MNLGRCALGRAMAVSLFVLVALGATACSTAPPGAEAGAAATASTRSHAFTVGRRAASHAVVQVARSLPGLHPKVTRCPGPATCDGVARATWSVSAQRVGARIPHGNGISAQAYLAVAAFRSPRAARRFVSRLRHKHRQFTGVFSSALKTGRGRRYTPGEQGVGSLGPEQRHGWRGWVLDMQHAYTFWDGSQSGQEFTRKFMSSRGRFVCAAFLDGRSLPELRHLVPAWTRLVTAVDG